jgi:hypothetical protein
LVGLIASCLGAGFITTSFIRSDAHGYLAFDMLALFPGVLVVTLAIAAAGAWLGLRTKISQASSRTLTILFLSTVALDVALAMLLPATF